MQSASVVSDDRERFQRHLEAVDISAPPRVQLTYGFAQGVSSLAVLDSSFNPPTRAHLHLITVVAEQLGLSHSLLLLAKQNADKPVLGANLLQRLEMMELVAASKPPASVLCGIIAHPLFVDKATALRDLCEGLNDGAGRVAVLVGFDTWVRIIDPKYYPQNGLDSALRQIFDAVEVVVASRDTSSVSGLEPISAAEQKAVVLSLPEAVTRKRLHFVHTSPQMAPLSSSAIRKALAARKPAPAASVSALATATIVAAVSGGDELPGRVLDMLPECLHEYVEAQGLYRGTGES